MNARLNKNDCVTKTNKHQWERTHPRQKQTNKKHIRKQNIRLAWEWERAFCTQLSLDCNWLLWAKRRRMIPPYLMSWAGPKQKYEKTACIVVGIRHWVFCCCCSCSALESVRIALYALKIPKNVSFQNFISPYTVIGTVGANARRSVRFAHSKRFVHRTNHFSNNN